MSLARAEKAEAAIRKAYEQFNAGDVVRAKKTLLAEKPASLAHPVGKTLSGLIAREEGRPKEALAAFESALADRPGDPNLTWLRGAVLGDLGRLDEGLAAIEAGLALRAAMPKARFERGRILLKLGRAREALDAFDAALEQNPAFPEALVERGKALIALGQEDHALVSYDLALELSPNHRAAREAKVDLLNAMRRLDEALATAEALVSDHPTEPSCHELLLETLALLDRPEEMHARLGRLRKLAGGQAGAEAFRGRALALTGDTAASTEAFERAVKLGRTDALTITRRGLLRLTRGRWAEGWEDYEHRFNTPGLEAALARCWMFPPWRGEDPAGRNILVFEEQGFGDNFQFSRYLPLLAARGATVTFLSRTRLVRILSSIGRDVAFVDAAKKSDPYDHIVPLLSLPRLFETRVDTVPADVPYLRPEPALVEKWRERIDAGRGFKIGIAWRGQTDRTADHARSFPVSALAPVAAIPGVRLISLQKAPDPAELAALPAGTTVEMLGDDFDAGPDAFVDTAAVMASLDLVISCDTSIAHLAGALARPVFVALKKVADWRWLEGRDDSPFYPTMRLFRQTDAGAWPVVFEAMAAAVAERAGGR